MKASPFSSKMAEERVLPFFCTVLGQKYLCFVFAIELWMDGFQHRTRVMQL